MVTIILTTLNSERFLARSIESCLHQTHANLEVLVVDGGSSDQTLEIVRSYSDPRIRLVHQEGNLGKLPGAINLGLRESRGDYITWTQDDCWYERDAIETMVSYLDEHPGIALVYTDYWIVDGQGDRVKYERVNSPDYILVGDDVIRMGFLFRRRVYQVVGPQETEHFPIHEVPWRLKIIQHFSIAPLHIPLLNYTVHEKSLTGRLGNWQLRRQTAYYLQEQGYINKAEYRQVLAQIDMDRAYDEFITECHFALFWRYAMTAIGKNWRLGLNRGLWKMMLVSLCPFRRRYRQRLLVERRRNYLLDRSGN